MDFSSRLSFSLRSNHVDQPLDPDWVLHSSEEWSSVLSWASVPGWMLINHRQDLLGPRPRVSLVPDQECLCPTCRIYLGIVSLVPYQNTLEAHRGPSHMPLVADQNMSLPWHQPAWSHTKNHRRPLGALWYLLGSFSSLVNWLGYHPPWEWVSQLH